MVSFFGLAKASFAETYYVDFQNGSNSNPGTKNQPWKSHPFMQSAIDCTGTGQAPAYTHISGDQFIFRGGVTWPAACFSMIINQAGLLNNYDYYGVDKNWYNGTTWSRPIFDGQQQVLAGNFQRIISFEWSGTEYPKYITLDNFEIKGLLIYANTSNFLVSSIAGIFSYTTMKNLYVHGWWYGPDVATDGGQNGGITAHAYDPFNTDGITLENSEVSGADTNKYGGSAVYRVSTIIDSVIHDAPNLALGACNISGSHFYNSQPSFDEAAHENMIYAVCGGQTCTIKNNLLDGTSAAENLYLAGWGGTTGDCYAYNNIVNSYNMSKLPVDIHPEYTVATNTQAAYLYNNTFIGQNGTGFCVRYGPGAGLDKVIIQNNHCIGEGMVTWDTQPHTTKTEDHNLVQTPAVAASQGYTINNLWAPTSNLGSTVDQGISQANIFSNDFLGISRPQGAGWDIGAYEYQSGNVVAPDAPSGLSVN